MWSSFHNDSPFLCLYSGESDEEEQEDDALRERRVYGCTEPHMVLTTCPCEKTCENYKDKDCNAECDGTADPVCQCSDDRVLHDGNCTLPDECPCLHSNHWFQHGDEANIHHDCRRWWGCFNALQPTITCFFERLIIYLFIVENGRKMKLKFNDCTKFTDH